MNALAPRSDGQGGLGNPLSLDRSVSTFDMRHVANMTGIYELPFGRGGALLQHSPRWVDSVVRGWQVSGKASFNSGYPFASFLKDDNDLGGTADSVRMTLNPGVPLLNGRNLDGWHAIGSGPHEWVTTKAVTWKRIFDPKRLTFAPAPGDRIVNGKEGRTLYLATDDHFGDCEVYLEYLLARGSNSGVFFNGHYEVQLFDSFGYAGHLQPGDNGGIYRLENNTEGWPPRINASRAPGEWQSLQVWFRAPRFQGGKKVANARFLRVLLNEVLVQEDVEVPLPTGHHGNPQEVPAGPLVFQGDHGPVAFRNVYVRLPAPSK